MKSFTKVLVAVALFASFDGGALAQNTTSSHQEAGKETVTSVNVPKCNYQSGRVDLNDGTFTCVLGMSGKVESEGIAFAEKLAEERLTAKRAAAAAYLEMDVIKMTFHIKDYGGIAITGGVELYPKKGIMKFRRSGSWCEVTGLETVFSITPGGNVLASMEKPRYRGCNRVYAELDPLTKEITVQVAPFEGGPKERGSRWTLDN